MSEDVYDGALNSIKSNSVYKDSLENEARECLLGVEVEGFLFIPDEIKPSTSFSSREYLRTSIMSGGEFVSRGVYKPKELSFNSVFEIDPSEPDAYDDVFGMMMNKNGGCEVISPYTGRFMGEVSIQRSFPKAKPHCIEVEVTIKEIPKVSALLYGDDIKEYPPVTSVSSKAVSVTGNKTQKNTDSFKDKLKVEYDNPYSDRELDDRYTNGF